jgi:hypothetical protein
LTQKKFDYPFLTAIWQEVAEMEAEARSAEGK